MAGAIIENLSGKKLSVLVVLLGLCQLLCFLIGGLVAPAPTSVVQILRRICLDKQYDAKKWYYPRGKGSCHTISSINTPEITNQHHISGNNQIFAFQIPLPKEDFELDYSRWHQNMIAMLMLDIPVHEEQSAVKDAVLTIDARLGYRNKNETIWKELAKSVEERQLSCEPPENKKSAESIYKCNPIPLFELGSIHHDFYLLNLRFPNFIEGSEKELNRFDIEVDDINMIFINQNGGFTKVWVSLKTIFFPFIIAIMFWFWNRISKLSRPAALLEYMLMCLGAALTFLNVPLEYLSLFVDCPWMTLVGDIRQGLFYAALLSFWLIFAGEHLMDDTERNRLHVYWRHLSAVLTGCLCLFIFDMCERGVQLKNPFNSIWATEVGTTLALAFIIIAGICAGLYFCFLSYMIWKVFRNISNKRKCLPAMASSRRMKYEGIIYRFKVLMLATLLCAAVTVIAFIMGQVSEGQRYEEGRHVEYSSAFLTGVYGMWNIYTFALICLYAPSHKKWPKDIDNQSSAGEEIEFSRLVSDTSELSSFSALAKLELPNLVKFCKIHLFCWKVAELSSSMHQKIKQIVRKCTGKEIFKMFPAAGGKGSWPVSPEVHRIDGTKEKIIIALDSSR